jgi:hypothetical protein
MRKLEEELLIIRDQRKADFAGQQYLDRNKSEFRKLQKQEKNI